MRILPLTLACALCAGPAAAAEFHDDFRTRRPEWRPIARADGKVEFGDGTLCLDLSSPTKGKVAGAELHLALAPPFTLEWEQCIERDSPHLYPAGLALRRGGEERARLSVWLGGAGLKGCWGYTGGQGAPAPSGKWYGLRLEVAADRQVLTVRERDGGTVVGEPAVLKHRLPSGEYFLLFYLNADPLVTPEGDEYEQDRGICRFAGLSITAAGVRAAAPPAPVRKVPVVFNRKMRWLDERDGLSGGFLAYDAAGNLPLTGAGAASDWLAAAPAKVAAAEGERSVLSLPAGAKGGRAVLRCFQFLLDGHPTLEVEGRPRNASWSLKVCIPDPYRAYQRVLATVPGAAGSQRVDLRTLYRKRGYDHRYAELEFVLDVTPKEPAAPAEVEFSLRLAPEACIAVRSPVVLSAAEAKTAGVPVEAVCVGADGQLLHGDQVRLLARVGKREVPLSERGNTGLFTGRLRGLGQGVHVAEVVVLGYGEYGKYGQYGKRKAAVLPTLPILPIPERGRALALAAAAPAGSAKAPTPRPATVRIRVHDGRFLERYDPAKHSYCLSDGSAVGPLLGDLYAWNPFVGINTPDERMIRGLDEYRQFAERAGKPLELCKQRPLTRAQVAAYMEYLGRSGVRAIRLAPNVSTAEEFLDAGGRLAPRGFEQLAVVLEEASRHGIYALINVFHYPYWSAGTGAYPPVQAYVDAGYTGTASFTKEAARPLLEGYLGELLASLRDDNAVLGYSLTGENDQAYGTEWINGLHRFVRARAPRQMVTLEQGGGIQHAAGRDPRAYTDFEPAHSAGVGYRTYYSAGHPTDCYALVNARVYDLAAPAFLAEVASGPGWYPGAGATWSHPDFITQVRDSFWAALLLRQPMAFSWSACLSEGERRVPTEIARAVDWNTFRRRRPAVAVRLQNPDDAQLGRLMRYDAALSALALDYDLLWGDAEAAGYAAVFDARADYAAPEWGKNLPEVARRTQALALLPGSGAAVLEGEDGTLAAYVRNTVEHCLAPGYGDGVNELHRRREKPRPVRLSVRGRPVACRYRLWDLDTGRVVREGRMQGEIALDLGETAHDYALLVLPAK